ncbi:MAG: hypothetical protein MI757_11405 [Pirellulales bacterium]|nr:hypothetical protein [Pirellulales bacterium]
MESTLHRQLKELYADDASEIEVRHGDYRIDVVSGDELIEIQQSSLSAIRNKIRTLVEDHAVVVVKPVVRRRLLVKYKRKGGRETDRRYSPKQGSLLDLFSELVYFIGVFPHERLALDVVLIDVEEHRHPRKHKRWNRSAWKVDDQRLIEVCEIHRLRTPSDLLALVNCDLPSPFHTGDLAKLLDVDRGFARQIAYCFRNMGAAEQVGKQGNTLLYELRATRDAA